MVLEKRTVFFVKLAWQDLGRVRALPWLIAPVRRRSDGIAAINRPQAPISAGIRKNQDAACLRQQVSNALVNGCLLQSVRDAVDQHQNDESEPW